MRSKDAPEASLECTYLEKALARRPGLAVMGQLGEGRAGGSAGESSVVMGGPALRFSLSEAAHETQEGERAAPPATAASVDPIGGGRAV